MDIVSFYVHFFINFIFLASVMLNVVVISQYILVYFCIFLYI